MKVRSLIRWLLWILGFAVITFFARGMFPEMKPVMVDVPRRLLIGWYHHLGTVPTNLTPTWQGVVAGAALIAVTTWALHLMLKMLHSLTSHADRPWRWKWSLSIMVLALILFATTCASVGIVHHGVWVMKNPLSYDVSKGILTRAISNVRQLATAVQIYQDDHAGKAPDRLAELEDQEIIERGNLLHLNTIETLYQPPTVWIYLKPPDGSMDPTLPILASPFPIARGKYVVAFADRNSQSVDAPQYEAALQRWREVHTGKTEGSPP